LPDASLPGSKLPTRPVRSLSVGAHGSPIVSRKCDRYSANPYVDASNEIGPDERMTRVRWALLASGNRVV